MAWTTTFHQVLQGSFVVHKHVNMSIFHSSRVKSSLFTTVLWQHDNLVTHKFLAAHIYLHDRVQCKQKQNKKKGKKNKNNIEGKQRKTQTNNFYASSLS